jgi:EAL domain-containing protein (putative c-di-GMP-specific phosphodiesterase class I)
VVPGSAPSGVTTGASAHDELSTEEWHDLVRAAARGEGVRAVYQPIVDVARGVVVGYEALARFADPRVSNPELWFAAAAAFGLGGELQACALRAALRARADLPSTCFLTLNVGPEVLGHPDVRQVWADQPDLRGLVVELTEHVEVRDAQALHLDLERLRAAGALIAVDDAGSGYAGLTQLLELRPALIKLDRALVSDLDRDETKRALVEMIGAFAGRLDAWLLAEGVERQGEMAVLADLGVPLAQGWYLGRPGPTWVPLAPDASWPLPPPPAATRTIRRLLERPPVAADEALALAAFADDSVDLVVVCDADRRPTGVVSSRSLPGQVGRDVLKVNVDTPLDIAAARAATRSAERWSETVVGVDEAGRYVGVVRVQRLLAALAADPA